MTTGTDRKTFKRLQSVRYEPCSAMRQSKKKEAAMYNKWYINPEQYFRLQCKNPKSDKKVIQNDQYVYKNVRNPDFWNWKHPFEGSKPSSVKSEINMDKLDTKSLEKFKRYIEASPAARRVPSIVQEVLSAKMRKKQQNEKT
jgi:hypothetical protein